MEPRRGRLAPALERWSRSAGGEERRTVVVRTAPGADPARVIAALEASGAVVESAGPGTATARIAPAGLRALAQAPGILAIDEPQELFPRG